MMAKGGAQRRAVGITVDRRASVERYDSGYYDYDYLAALETLKKPESESERADRLWTLRWSGLRRQGGR